jgi:hypothetical protein
MMADTLSGFVRGLSGSPAADTSPLKGMSVRLSAAQ